MTPTSEVTPSAASGRGALLAVFIAAIFWSAALLFVVEPMFTKMVLPRLGGSPSVWSVAMVFFQTALLAGYAYAHALVSIVPRRIAVGIHIAVMLAACLALPLGIAGGWGRPPDLGEPFWLLALFAVSIGLPFFALAANGPLLQAWFAQTDHPAAKDPYFLYAASNVGSFLALISYPLVIEPFIPLGLQTRLWSIGFFVLIAMIAGCGALLWRARDQAPPATEAAEASPPTWADVGAWVALAAVPAALLIAVTAHISTDVAAVPLLWVIPLALYLLTFVLVFARKPFIPHWLVVAVQPVFILALVGQIILEPVKTIVGAIGIHLVVFFVIALVCHGELVRRRPAPQHLTAFYLFMSAGGMIGGIAAGLVAPYVFNTVAEYPILIVLAVLCRPGLKQPATRGERLLELGALAAAAVILFVLMRIALDLDERTFNLLVGLMLISTVMFWRAPLPFAAIVAVALMFNRVYLDTAGGLSVRSFFGVVKVTDYTNANGTYRVLTHGTTIHGGQRIRDASGNPITGRPEVLMYYYDGSAMAQVMDAVRERNNGPISYAVVGLGAGSLACRAHPLDTLRYYEIDPKIVKLATDPAVFTFISECRPEVAITLGDARLTLADAPDGSYDIIYVDAFTSDAIPIHLMTREAMAIYEKKLRPHGIVVMHISNRHLELGSVVTGIAAANGMVTRLNEGGDYSEDDSLYKFIGTVAVSARADEDFGSLASSSYWPRKEPDPRQRVWTDDYSNIVGAIWRNWKGE
jgi:hypothetical protein